MGKQTRSKCAQREYTVGVKLAGVAQVENGDTPIPMLVGMANWKR